jgi:hypothetical protein
MNKREKYQQSTPTAMTFSGVLAGEIDLEEKNYKLSVTDNLGNKYNVKIYLTPVGKELETFEICWQGGRQVPC